MTARPPRRSARASPREGPPPRSSRAPVAHPRRACACGARARQDPTTAFVDGIVDGRWGVRHGSCYGSAAAAVHRAAPMCTHTAAGEEDARGRPVSCSGGARGRRVAVWRCSELASSLAQLAPSVPAASRAARRARRGASEIAASRSTRGHASCGTTPRPHAQQLEAVWHVRHGQLMACRGVLLRSVGARAAGVVRAASGPRRASVTGPGRSAS